MFEKALAYKKPILIGAGLLALLGFVLFVMDRCSDRNERKRLEAANAEVKKLEGEAANINASIHNLKIQEAEKQAEVNAARANLAQIRNEVDEAQNIANQAIDNANAVNSRNFNGTSTDDANRARCAAFPDSPECRR
jgi:multidrug resistance efflux pump